MAGEIVLKRGKEKALLNHHPWVFSGAIKRINEAGDGDDVDILDSEGNWLARGSFNSHSQIAARVWTFEREQEVDRAFFLSRLEASISRRGRSGNQEMGEDFRGACRLVNAESDGIPGLVVDRYQEFVVAQYLTIGVESHKNEIVDALEDLLRPRGIYERSDSEVRKKEGLVTTSGVLRGQEPPDRLQIIENSLNYLVDVKQGHKTGFYLDQSENRRKAAPYLLGEVLNVFAYTGGFGLNAAKEGAVKVLNIDTSAKSLQLAQENFELNRLEAGSENVVADAFQILRSFREENRRFDAIVLDPPKFVASQGQMERGLRGYKDINLLAFQILRAGGALVTFSCSGLVASELFQKVIFGAARDADREGLIVEKMTQASDHPISLAFPEAEYLKGLIVKVL